MTCKHCVILVGELNRCRRERDEFIRRLKENLNHYPEDVFIPMTDIELKLRVEVLRQANISPDREAGHLMRIAENNTKAMIDMTAKECFK